jgi:hypothetical protein
MYNSVEYKDWNIEKIDFLQYIILTVNFTLSVFLSICDWIFRCLPAPHHHYRKNTPQPFKTQNICINTNESDFFAATSKVYDCTVLNCLYF